MPMLVERVFFEMLAHVLRLPKSAMRRNALALLVACALAAGGVVLQAVGPLRGTFISLDAAAHDSVLRDRPPASYFDPSASGADPRAFITIVAIDERTLSELGAYNGGYPRRYHAQVIENLLAAPPRVIALDLGFFEPTPDD